MAHAQPHPGVSQGSSGLVPFIVFAQEGPGANATTRLTVRMPFKPARKVCTSGRNSCR